MTFPGRSPIKRRKNGWFCFLLFGFLFVMWSPTNVYSQQKLLQSTTGKKSPAVIAGGNVTIIYKDTIKLPPSPLGLPEFDTAYKMAVSFKAAENWKKAAELFSTIYRTKPDYPTLAMNYSICLSKLGKNDDALAVMFSIPNSEHYQFLNFNKGITLVNLKRYTEASKYLTLAMKDYRKNDCRYWAARTLLISSRYYLSSSLTELIKDTNDFIAVVGSDVRRLNDYQCNADPYHEVDINEVQSEALITKNGCVLFASNDICFNGTTKTI